MSSPIALPVGPTRRAEIRTSAPAPDPRSSTVSPSCKSATAVGTPHPSDALIAVSGMSALDGSLYRAAPNTSPASPGLHVTDPVAQQPACPDPAEAALAAEAYLARTVSRMSPVSVRSAMRTAPPARRG